MCPRMLFDSQKNGNDSLVGLLVSWRDLIRLWLLLWDLANHGGLEGGDYDDQVGLCI